MQSLAPPVKALTHSNARRSTSRAVRLRHARERRPTIYEVAREAGVSIATVSRVQRNIGRVSPGTRARVKEVVEALGYRPSRLGRSLARGRHDATGIVFPDLTGPYYSSVILGYEEASAADGQSVLILATHRRHASALQVIDLADRVDGLVLFGRTVDDDVVAELHRRGVPTVLLARPATVDADTVRAENEAAARSLTRHLIGHGHSRIAFIGDPTASPDADERWSGFLAAHRDAGLAPWRDPVPSAFRESAGGDAARALLSQQPRPTAVVCANDEIAIGVIGAAREAGLRLPDDLAITGWDDIPAARHITPALTTVRQPMFDLGRRAAELLRERITTTRLEPRHETLPTELVIRSSCGCPVSEEEAEADA